MGSESAFKREGLQSKGLKAVLDTGPKHTPKDPRGPIRHPKVTPGPPKSEPKATLGPTKKDVWKCLGIGGHNSPKVNSHASKTAI